MKIPDKFRNGLIHGRLTASYFRSGSQVETVYVCIHEYIKSFFFLS